MDDVFERFTMTILKMSKLVQKIKSLEIHKFGLKAVHVMCLYHLRMHPDGLTASELCRQTLDDKAAISRAIAQLREGGYVVGDAGRHNAAVTLTEKGEQLAQYVTVRAARAVAAGSADLTEEQRSLFYRTLLEICGNLEHYYRDLLREQADAQEDV